MLRILLILLVVGFGAIGANGASTIKSDENLVFFPTLARRIGSASWELPVHGWVYEPERRQVALAVLRQALPVDTDTLTPEEADLFAERARLFLADNERGKKISIQLGGRGYEIGATAANGHFHGRLTVNSEMIEQIRLADRSVARIAYRAESDRGAPWGREIIGEVFLVEPTGISVISDVDDTIKISEVRNREALLRNTFVRPFRPVPGMAHVYQSWADQGVQFHYVTASPCQLYPALDGFIRSNGFPGGSFHMKLIRVKDWTAADLFKSPEAYKLNTIEPLLRAFPERRFLLVGDSGERDPEVYATLARKHPEQIRRILIRDVTGEAKESERYRKAYRGVPTTAWRIFRNPKEVADALAGLD